MNETIAMGRLAEIMSEATGCDRDTALRYLSAFTSTVQQALKDGESVKIKGIGTFRRVGGTASPVGFIPDRELASLINAPFSFFEAVELDDSVTDSMLEAEDTDMGSDEPEAAAAAEYEPEPEAVVVVEEKEIAASAPEPEPEAVVAEAEPVAESAEDELSEVADAATSEPEEESEAETASETEREPVVEESEPTAPARYSERRSSEIEQHMVYRHGRHHRHRRPYACVFFCAGLVSGLIIGAIVTYLSYNHIRHFIMADGHLVETTEPMVTVVDDVTAPDASATVQSGDTAAPYTASLKVGSEAAPATAVKPEEQKPVYDTVTSTRFLTTMAREHYGVMDYWVYIYDENASKLGNPNRIKPGTRVVIPPVAKYRISPHEEENLAAARRRAAEIYSRY